MDYQTIDEAASKWGVSSRQVRAYCAAGRIPGAIYEHGAWRIPWDAVKPVRKSRTKAQEKSVLGILEKERKTKLKGGLYHQLQIDFTYNSNHIEGSRLTHEQTRWIFETKTLGQLDGDMPVDDVVETTNHFRAVDTVISTAKAALTENYIKRLHAILKSGTTNSRQDWFAVGDYKRLENTVGEFDTVKPAAVHSEMARLLDKYGKCGHTLEDIAAFHVRFEAIHPFQDGNGRVGRLILLKECLKYDLTPILITENIRQFYYKGLSEWQKNDNKRRRLMDTFRTGQDTFAAMLRHYGHSAAADLADQRDGR